MYKKLNDLAYKTQLGKKIGSWYIRHETEVKNVSKTIVTSIVVYNVTHFIQLQIEKFKSRSKK
jgi:hypothetical protein